MRIVYRGQLDDGTVGGIDGPHFAFKRGVPFEVPDDFGAKLLRGSECVDSEGKRSWQSTPDWEEAGKQKKEKE